MDDDLETKFQTLQTRVKELEDKLLLNKPIALPSGIKMPRFDGNGDFYKFLREFNLLATASGWHPPDCVRLLPLFLEGEAKEIYQNIPGDKKKTWKELTEKLAEQTKKLDGPMWARKMLARAKLGHETVTEFANKVREWVEQACPDPDYTKDARENESIHYFLSGLPTNLKRKIFFMEKPKSLAQAISQTKKVLQIKEEIEKDERGEEVKQQIAELKEQVNAIEIKNKLNNEINDNRTFLNSNWRANNRGRGNVRGLNRGNYWRPNSNYNPRNYNFGYRNTNYNANYIPLGQNQNRDGNVMNRGRFFGLPNNQGRVQSFRGNPRGEKQRYRINMIGEQSVPSSPSAPLRRSPTPALTFLTISTIFCLFFVGSMAQYQLCSEKVPMTPIWLPNISECRVPEHQKAAERKITLFLPVRFPKQFPIYNCYQKVTEICTGSFLFWKEIKSQETFLRGVNVDKCKRFKSRMDVSLNRLGENLWATEKPEKVEYAWTGEKCVTTANDFIEKGHAGILDFFLITSFGNKLNPYTGWEEAERQTLMWEIPEPSEIYWATHIPVGEFSAEITDDAIIIESEQSVFYFEKEKPEEREGVVGVPEEAYKMSNDVFIIIHSIKSLMKREIKKKTEPSKKSRPIKQEVFLKDQEITQIIRNQRLNFTKAEKINLNSSTHFGNSTNNLKVKSTVLPKIVSTTESPTTTTTTTTPPITKAKTTVSPAKLIVSTTIRTKIEPQNKAAKIDTKIKDNYTFTEQMSLKNRLQTQQIYKNYEKKEGKMPEVKNNFPKEHIKTTAKPMINTITQEPSKNQFKTISTQREPILATSKPISEIKKQLINTNKKIQTKIPTTPKSPKKVVQKTSTDSPANFSQKTGKETNDLLQKTETINETIINVNVSKSENKIMPLIGPEGSKTVKGNEKEIQNEMKSKEEYSGIETDSSEEDISYQELDDDDSENENFETYDTDRRKRTTVTTPDARWTKRVEKSKLRKKGGQENKNTNTRVNYALYKLNEERKTQYDHIFIQACENSNFQLQLAKAILQINPNEGIRKIFDRDDLVARWKEQTLEVGFCVPIIPEKIIWDKKIASDCYEQTPILAQNMTFFLIPGTREISLLGKKIECEKMELENMENVTQKEIFKKLNQNFGKIRPRYRNMQNPLVLKSGALFESDTIRLEETMLEYRKKANNLPSYSLRLIQRPNLTEVINLAKEEATEKMNIVLGNAENWVEIMKQIPKKAKEAVSFLKGISYSLIVIPIIILIVLVIYIIVKYWAIISAGFRVGTIAARVVRGIIGQKKKKTRIVAIPTAPEVQSIDEEAYVLDYLPPRRVATITNDPRRLPAISVNFNGLSTCALVDSCASVSYCRESTARKAGLKITEIDGKNKNLSAANDSQIQIIGKTNAKMRILDLNTGKTGEWELTLLVSPDHHCPGPLLLGLPFLTDLKGVIALGERKVRIGEIWTNIVSVIDVALPKRIKVTLENTEIFEPRTENIISAKVRECFSEQENFLVKGIHQYPSLLIGRTLVAPGNKNFVTLQIMNAGNVPVKVYEGSHLADLEKVGINALPGDEIQPKDYIPPETKWYEKLPTLPFEKLKRPPSERLILEGTKLGEESQSKLKKIVDKYSEAFVGDDGKIGLYCGPIVHKIDLIPGSLPFHFRPYRYSPETQKEIERQIKIMLDQNIIRESESEFCSPIVMVPKADKKSWRFAIDYRALNKMTKKRVFHLPNIQELLDLMGSKKYYTSMDMQSGFMQIPMAKEDIDKTAFISHLGIFEFITMPFGLTAAPDTFQRVMNSIRRRLTAAMLIYLDDIIIGSENEESHLVDIENFLKLLKEVGLKLKIDKCHWGMAEIRYLGFLLSEKGVRMDPKQVSVVQNFRAPKSLTELKSLLGALTYFRRFIKNFAHIARPLQILTQDKFEGKIVENWGKEQDQALNILKEMLTSAPVLQSPRFGKPFTVECDASKKAIGAVLLQENGPVAFVSRALNRHETNYPSIEREALALVYAVKEFSPYIVGSGVTKIITDCSALTGMMKAKELKNRMEKYQITLQSYDLEITYRPGKKNKAADFLSRYNIPGIENEENKQTKLETNLKISSITDDKNDENKDRISLVMVINAQRKVKELVKIFYILKTGKFPKDDIKWKRIVTDYCLLNGAIFYKKGRENSEKPKLVIPYELRQKIFHETHNEGHFGFEKTWTEMKNRFYWTGMKEDVKLMIETCESCQKRKIQPGDSKSCPSVPIKAPEEPFQRVHCDLMGPLKRSDKGNSYVFLAIDSFTKWIMGKAIPNQKADTIVETFVETVIHQHSTPEIVVTDQGRQFTSELFSDVSKIYGFVHQTSTSYHQQSNGQIEGSMRIMANIISQMVNEKGNNWDEVLSHAIFIYNSSIHTVTKYSPFFLLHLRNPKMPTDRLLKLPSQDECNSDISVYTRKHADMASKAWEAVKENILKGQLMQKEENDKVRKAEEKEFEIGELVLLRKEVLNHKFDKRWLGPLRCVGIDRDKKNVIVQQLEGKGKMKKVHQEKIKKFYGPAILPLRESDEPLNWEIFVGDKNLEQEEAEEDSEENYESPNSKENNDKNENNTKKDKGSMSKFGFESSDEEEPSIKISFLRLREDSELSEMPENAEPNEREIQENDFPCTVTEIFLEGEIKLAYTSWPESNLIPLDSSIPTNFVKEHWEIFTNEFGKQYLTAWLFGRNFELFLNDNVNIIVLGIREQFLINDEWISKTNGENETYWEQLGEFSGQILEIQRIPDINISHNENKIISNKGNDQNNNLIFKHGINVITDGNLLMSIFDLNNEYNEEDSRNKNDKKSENNSNKKSQIFLESMDFENSDKSPMDAPKVPEVEHFNEDALNAEEKRLRTEIEELKRQLEETNKRKEEAEKKRNELEKQMPVDEIVLDMDEEDEEEEEEEEVPKDSKRSRIDPVATKELVEKTINEKWEATDLITIDPRSEGSNEVPKGIDSREWEDSRRLLTREERERGWNDFISTTTTLDIIKENRLKMMGKIGLGPSARRMAENSMKMAEKSILQSEAIQPEGMRKPIPAWNQLEDQRETAEELERRKRFAAKTPAIRGPFVNCDWEESQNNEKDEKIKAIEKKICEKVNEIQQKMTDAFGGVKELTKEVEELTKLAKNEEVIRKEQFQATNNQFVTPNSTSWRQHDDFRYPFRGTGGRWMNSSRGRGRQRPYHYNNRRENEGWGRNNHSQPGPSNANDEPNR